MLAPPPSSPNANDLDVNGGGAGGGGTTDEPFEVTDSLKAAFQAPGQTPLPPQPPDDETPTVRMFSRESKFEAASLTNVDRTSADEMQRGDINIRTSSANGDASGTFAAPPPSTFMPLSVRQPSSSSIGDDPDATAAANSLLMPQEVPTDVELPRVYAIGPRLVLPVDATRGASGDDKSQTTPRAPPAPAASLPSRVRPPPPFTRVTSPPSRPGEVSLFVAPRRGGNAALTLPISTPRTVPHALAAWQGEMRETLAPLDATRAGTLLPPVGASSGVDYADEFEIGVDGRPAHVVLPPAIHRELIGPPALPPAPSHANSDGRVSPRPPALEPPDGPPSINRVSSPPGYTREHITRRPPPTATPRPRARFTTTTPYFTQSLLPRRPTATTRPAAPDANAEYSPPVPRRPPTKSSVVTTARTSVNIMTVTAPPLHASHRRPQVGGGGVGAIRPSSSSSSRGSLAAPTRQDVFSRPAGGLEPPHGLIRQPPHRPHVKHFGECRRGKSNIQLIDAPLFFVRRLAE